MSDSIKKYKEDYEAYNNLWDKVVNSKMEFYITKESIKIAQSNPSLPRETILEMAMGEWDLL